MDVGCPMDSLDQFAAGKLAALDRGGLRRTLVETARHGLSTSSAADAACSPSPATTTSILRSIPPSRPPRWPARSEKRCRAGSGASRLVTGNHPLHAELEVQLARLQGTEAACVFGSGSLSMRASSRRSSGPMTWCCSTSSRMRACGPAPGSRATTVLTYRHNDVGHAEDLLRAQRGRHPHAGDRNRRGLLDGRRPRRAARPSASLARRATTPGSSPAVARRRRGRRRPRLDAAGECQPDLSATAGQRHTVEGDRRPGALSVRVATRDRPDGEPRPNLDLLDRASPATVSRDRGDLIAADQAYAAAARRNKAFTHRAGLPEAESRSSRSSSAGRRPPWRRADASNAKASSRWRSVPRPCRRAPRGCGLPSRPRIRMPRSSASPASCASTCTHERALRHGDRHRYRQDVRDTRIDRRATRARPHRRGAQADRHGLRARRGGRQRQWSASGGTRPRRATRNPAIAEVSPFRFVAPLAPDMAAAREKRARDFAALIAVCRAAITAAKSRYDLLIEGVGGVIVAESNPQPHDPRTGRPGTAPAARCCVARRLSLKLHHQPHAHGARRDRPARARGGVAHSQRNPRQPSSPRRDPRRDRTPRAGARRRRPASRGRKRARRYRCSRRIMARLLTATPSDQDDPWSQCRRRRADPRSITSPAW